MTLPARICPLCDMLVTTGDHCPFDNVSLLPLSTDPTGDKLNLVGRSILPTLPGADGRYFVVKLVGSGGFGSVYLAWHNELNRPCAIKVGRSSSRMVGWEHLTGKRLRKDDAAAALVDHPNVLRVYDAGMLDDTHRYVALEYLRGSDLELVASHGATPEHAVALARQATLGLHAVHGARLVHRDVKLDNLFLHDPSSPNDPGGLAPVVKIIDFGAAHPFSEPQFDIIGTPQYMAPEQFSLGATLDGRADVYSLGVALYRLLTGRFPFELPPDARPSFEGQVTAMLTQEPSTVRSLVPTISSSLSEVVMRALSRSRQQRFETMLYFNAALGSTPEAQPPSEHVVDLTPSLADRRPNVEGRESLRILYLSNSNHVQWRHSDSGPTINIGRTRVLTAPGFRVLQADKAYTRYDAIPDQYHISPDTRRTLRIQNRNGTDVCTLDVCCSSTSTDGTVLLDLGNLGRFRAEPRYKNCLVALLPKDSASLTIVCLLD
jgi:serine/threonine protein kinase